jgi:hypothetical protein
MAFDIQLVPETRVTSTHEATVGSGDSEPYVQSAHGTSVSTAHESVLSPFGVDCPTSWLLPPDFDIGAIDVSLNLPISEWARFDTLLQCDLSNTTHVQRTATAQVSTITELETAEDRPIENLEPITYVNWYTQLRSEDWRTTDFSRASSEPFGENLHIDERYRDKLSHKLRPSLVEETPLSVDYLNICLRLYFRRFHHVFPVVHQATFRPNSQNALLFLSMCSIGSLFIGTPTAASQGHKIFTRLNKAILASWETHLTNTKEEALSMVQAALLGQTFGMLSGKSNDLVMVDAFQGTMLAWARRIGAFIDPEPVIPISQLPNVILRRSWQNWVHSEQLARLKIALHVHDGELASMFHHEPLARHAFVKYSTIVDDSLFEARSAEDWFAILTRRQIIKAESIRVSLDVEQSVQSSDRSVIQSLHKQSPFVAYGMLANIGACISDYRQAELLSDSSKQVLAERLVEWHEIHAASAAKQESDTFALFVLWHSCFIALYSDVDMLERVSGRGGHRVTEDCLQIARQWAASKDGLRCLTHSHLLQDHVENMGMTSTPPIHVPRGLFFAGLVSITFYRFNETLGRASMLHQQATELPEIRVLNTSRNSHSLESLAVSGRYGQNCTGLVYEIVDLLRKMGRWGISDQFAELLDYALRARGKAEF